MHVYSFFFFFISLFLLLRFLLMYFAIIFNNISIKCQFVRITIRGRLIGSDVGYDRLLLISWFYWKVVKIQSLVLYRVIIIVYCWSIIVVINRTIALCRTLWEALCSLWQLISLDNFRRVHPFRPHCANKLLPLVTDFSSDRKTVKFWLGNKNSFSLDFFF